MRNNIMHLTMKHRLLYNDYTRSVATVNIETTDMLDR